MKWVAALTLALACGACGRGELRYEDLFRARAASAELASAKRSPRTDRHELGRAVYNFRCYYCHGYSGDARTLASTFLVPPPRNFHAVSPDDMSRQAMREAVRNGRPGTAMKGFADVIPEDEIDAVVDFVRDEFMRRKARNTRYHTRENGWPDHNRYAAAFPFATGELALDTPWESLSPRHAAGKRLFLSSCVSCHDRARTSDEKLVWEGRPLSYPRNNYIPGGPTEPVDATTSASPYAVHDRAPVLANMTAEQKRGERLYQSNCAFCHAADGTAKNWIGSFMEPHPRNLTDPGAMGSMTRARLRQVIRDGLPGTSMPAWKEVLKPRDIDDVIAYVSRAFHNLQD